jgi:phytoene synthase
VDEADRKHVEQAVEQGDPDRFVSLFFAPVERREHLLALYAFDAEVAHIGEVAREAMAGRVRLAWWREQIVAIYAGAAMHTPTARGLAQVVRTRRLPRELFEAALDARELDLKETPFRDEAAMAAHADAVAGGVLRLACRILGAEHRADEPARDAGRAVAYLGHLRDLSYFAERRRCRLPLTWLEEAGINAEDVFAAQSVTPALRTVVERLRSRVLISLRAVNQSRFPRAAMPALALATLARFGYPRALRMPRWQRVVRLAMANLIWRV